MYKGPVYLKDFLKTSISSQVHGHADMGGEDVLAGQRQHPVARGDAAEHAVVLRRRHLRREGHQAHAELGKDKVQEDEHRPPAQLHHPRGERRRLDRELSMDLKKKTFKLFWARI